MLQVRIHYNHIVSGCIFQAGVHTSFFSEVAGKRNIPYPHIRFCHFPELGERTISGTVIDEKQLKFRFRMFLLDLCHYLLNFCIKERQYLLLIIARYYNRDLFHSNPFCPLLTVVVLTESKVCFFRHVLIIIPLFFAFYNRLCRIFFCFFEKICE